MIRAGAVIRNRADADMITYESDCCGAGAHVAGRTTKYYVCSSCGKPCMAATRCTYPGTEWERRELAGLSSDHGQDAP